MLKPEECKGCPFEMGIGPKHHNQSLGFIMPEGAGTNGVALIGEAGGYEEYVEGLPFRPRAQSGSKLQEVIRRIAEEEGRDIRREHFVINNAMRCSPTVGSDFLLHLCNNPYESNPLAQCRDRHFERWVRENPGIRCFVALGRVALMQLTIEADSVLDKRGYVFRSRYRNSVTGEVIPVVATLHPSFVRRGNGHLTPYLVEDIKKGMRIADGTYTNYPFHPSYKKPKYFDNGDAKDFRKYYEWLLAHPEVAIAFDIENPKTQGGSYAAKDDEKEDSGFDADIVQIQFSHKRGFGIAVPWRGDFIGISRDVLALPNVKFSFNGWNYDEPRLRKDGVRVRGKHYDLMWMWKHWHPKLERNLQAVASMCDFPQPWKHLFGANFGFYGCCDVDALHYIWEKIKPLMVEMGVWGGYENHVRKLHKILDRQTREVGIPVNDEKRRELDGKFREERKYKISELQQLVPEECRTLEPKRKDKATGRVSIGFVREPETIRELREEYGKSGWKDDNSVNGGENELSGSVGGDSFERFVRKERFFVEVKTKSNKGEKVKRKYYRYVKRVCQQWDKKTKQIVEVERWCREFEFNPGSSEQLQKYLKWQQGEQRRRRGELEKKLEGVSKIVERRKIKQEIKEAERLEKEYEVPLKVHTKKPTTGGDELEEIYWRTGDKVIEEVMDVRSLNTNINNFIPNWKPAKDGRVHPEWNYGPPSGQLATRKPNVQNCSKHTDRGQEFRGIIEAPKGYVFIEFDKKSFHVATAGYVAEDRDYIRFSQLDPHSIFTSYVLHDVFKPVDLSLSDKDILEYCKEIKKWCKEQREKDSIHGVNFRQDCAKPTVLGNQLGLGPVKLQRQNRRYIPDVATAKEYQQTIAEMFPKVTASKEVVRELAHRQKYLKNDFGRIQWFYDVYHFTWDKKNRGWKKGAGEEFNDPIGFAVQSPAFGMITEEMLEMERREYLQRYGFCNTIHDSVLFLCEKKLADNCLVDISTIMNSPCKKLVNEATGEEGLVVKVEASMGRNWKNWHEKDNPEGMNEVKGI